MRESEGTIRLLNLLPSGREDEYQGGENLTQLSREEVVESRGERPRRGDLNALGGGRNPLHGVKEVLGLHPNLLCIDDQLFAGGVDLREGASESYKS